MVFLCWEGCGMPVERVTDSDVSPYNTEHSISADQLYDENGLFFLTKTMWEHYSSGLPMVLVQCYLSVHQDQGSL